MSGSEINNNDVAFQSGAQKPVNAFSGRSVFCEADAPLIEAYRNGFYDKAEIVLPQETPSGRQLAAWVEEPEPVPFAFQEFTRRIEKRFDAEQIAQRVSELGAEISACYAASETPLVVIGVLKGCSPFLSDLLRKMNSELPIEVDFVHTDFNVDHPASGKNVVGLSLQARITGKNVLVVDDIVDTGETLYNIIDALYERQPRSINACVFLEKLAHKCHYIPELRYRCFEIQNGWAVGYGMDYHQYYRNLPYVGIIQSIVPEDGDEIA